MPPTKIPNDHHVMRYVRRKGLRRDENGIVLGILPQALELRPKEEFLSVTWLEHFSLEYEEGFIEASKAICKTLEVKKKDGFSVSKVEDIFKGCASFDVKIRILHEPEEENSGHVAVRRFPRDNIELLDLLAAESFIDTRIAENFIP